jgi:hypothetical protein
VLALALPPLLLLRQHVARRRDGRPCCPGRKPPFWAVKCPARP